MEWTAKSKTSLFLMCVMAMTVPSLAQETRPGAGAFSEPDRQMIRDQMTRDQVIRNRMIPSAISMNAALGMADASLVKAQDSLQTSHDSLLEARAAIITFTVTSGLWTIEAVRVLSASIDAVTKAIKSNETARESLQFQRTNIISFRYSSASPKSTAVAPPAGPEPGTDLQSQEAIPANGNVQPSIKPAPPVPVPDEKDGSSATEIFIPEAEIEAAIVSSAQYAGADSGPMEQTVLPDLFQALVWNRP